jgi:hypothetical protein
MRWNFSLVFELKAVWQNNDICDYTLHHALTWWTQMNMHLTKTWPIYNFCRKHSSTFPSTCSHKAFNFNHVWHKNHENSYFDHNSTVPRVTALTAQHCMDTKENVPPFQMSLCLSLFPLYPSYCISFIIRYHQLLRYNLYLTVGFQK